MGRALVGPRGRLERWGPGPPVERPREDLDVSRARRLRPASVGPIEASTRMGHHQRRRDVGFAIVLMACLGMGCAHTREVFYPRVPRRAARVRLMPKVQSPRAGGRRQGPRGPEGQADRQGRMRPRWPIRQDGGPGCGPRQVGRPNHTRLTSSATTRDRIPGRERWPDLVARSQHACGRDRAIARLGCDFPPHAARSGAISGPLSPPGEGQGKGLIGGSAGIGLTPSVRPNPHARELSFCAVVPVVGRFERSSARHPGSLPAGRAALEPSLRGSRP